MANQDFVNLTIPILVQSSNINICNTTVLTLPINCVLDGQQREPVSKLMGLNGAITGPLRGIFNE